MGGSSQVGLTMVNGMGGVDGGGWDGNGASGPTSSHK